MLLFAVILTAIDFLISKLYQKNHGNTLISGLKFNFFVGLFSSIIFIIINNFRIEFSLYSCVLAVIMTITAIVCIVMGFTIIAQGKTAYYVFFKNIGAMVVPYAWGMLFLEEKPTLLNVSGLVLIIVSIFLMNSDMGKILFETIFLCLCVFITAGIVSIISKEHSINTQSVSPIGYIILTSFVKIVFCGGLLLFLKEKREKTKNKDKISLSVLTASSALVTGIAYMLQLIFAKDMPATLLYPVLTGGTIIASTVFARVIFKEKLSKKEIISIILCFVGTFMFV